LKKLALTLALYACLSVTFARDYTCYIPIILTAPQAKPFIALMDRISELSGLTFRLYDQFPLPRALYMVENDQLDIYFGVADTMDLSGTIVVGTPILTGTSYVVAPRGRTVKSLDDLTGKRVIAATSSAALEKIRADARYKAVEADDMLSAVNMLAAGRGDFAIMHEVGFLNAISAQPSLADRVTLTDVAYITVNNVIAVAKNDADIAPRLEAAMEKLKETGELARILAGE